MPEQCRMTLLSGKKTVRAIRLRNWRRWLSKGGEARRPLYEQEGSVIRPFDVFDDEVAPCLVLHNELLSRMLLRFIPWLELNSVMHVTVSAALFFNGCHHKLRLNAEG
jgi:hypothetical protein